MKTPIYIIAALLAFVGLTNACENCPRWAPYDWCEINIEEENPAQRRLIFRVSHFWTCLDGWDLNIPDIMPIFYVELENICTGKYQIAYTVENGWWKIGYDQGFYCANFCNDGPPGCACDCPGCCGVNDQSDQDYFVNLSGIAGNFHVYASFKGEIIYDRWFEFDDTGEPPKLIRFHDIDILDAIDESIPHNATLDIDEQFRIRVIAEWENDIIDRYIWAVIKSDGIPDSLCVYLPYIGGDYNDAEYSGCLSGGMLRQLYPDAEGQFYYNHRDNLTFYPVWSQCEPTENTPEAHVYLGLYKFYVSQIFFRNDHPLCKETPVYFPTEPITEPEWKINEKNEPICYTREEQVKMDLILTCSFFTPWHSMYLRVDGICGVDEYNYSTYEYPVYLNSRAEVINGVESMGHLPNSINSRSLEYEWRVRLTPHRPPRAANHSGPHYIYVVYDTPIDNEYSRPTRTLGLDLVCGGPNPGGGWAIGRSTPDAILTAIMNGLYGSGIIYNPALLPNAYEDPYQLYHFADPGGQCNSFARLFLVLTHSVGLAAYKTDIYSGTMEGNDVYFNVWNDNCTLPSFFCFLWGQGMRDPQGHQAYIHGAHCSPYWEFQFHVVPTFNDISYDPVFNIKANVSTQYGNWLKFYYTGEGQHLEPPVIPPDIVNYPAGTNPIPVFHGLHIDYNFLNDFYHPNTGYLISTSGVHDSGAFSFAKSAAPDINIVEWPGELSAGYYQIIDHLRGDLYGSSYSSVQQEMGRKRDRKNPGDYLISPLYERPQPVAVAPDSANREKLKLYVKDMFRAEYASAAIVDYISDYKNVLSDSSRTEFFGRFNDEGQKMSLGGWYDRFAVAGLYLPYTGVKEFIAAAQRYFALPNISVDSVKLTVQQDSLYFYEYLDHDRRFRLRGFDVSLSSKTIKGHHDVFVTMVIEFTKYYDEEFVP
jgi:hypothetical protein